MILKVLGFVAGYIAWIMLVMIFIFNTPTVAPALGIHDTKTGTEIPPLVIGIMLVAFIAPSLLFNRVVNGKPRWTKGVLADGKQASATITRVDDTGLTINNTYYVKLHLRVEPSGESSFEAVITAPVSRIAVPSNGDTLWVKYDPKNKKHITILDQTDVQPLSEQPSYQTLRSSPVTDVANELAKLAELHRNGDLTDAEYQAAKKKLLS